MGNVILSKAKELISERRQVMKKYIITKKDYDKLSSVAVRRADPDIHADRIFLNYFVYQRESGKAVEEALKKLGGELDGWFLTDPDYWTQYGKFENEDDISYLRKIVSGQRNMASKFAFSRLTGYTFPVPENDAYSYKRYNTGIAIGLSPEAVKAFCQEMIDSSGIFAKEAEIYIGRIPRYLYSRVQDYTLDDTVNVITDKRVENEAIRLGEELGDHGIFRIKLAGLGKISVLAETETYELCEKYLMKFDTFIRGAGILECKAHDWKIIRVTDHGDSTYDSGGGEAQSYVVTEYVCTKCGRTNSSYVGTPNEGF